MIRRVAAGLTATLVGALFIAAMPGAKPQPPGGGRPGGGFGPPGGQERKILKDFDKNNDGWLNAEERAVARESVKKGGGQGGFGGPKGGFGRGGEPGKPGPKVNPSEVKTYPEAKLYEPTVLRTIFLEFENKDWEAELADFHNTDVEVPAQVIVDGKKYANVGVHFRGMSSYMGVPAGSKRSLNLAFDLADSKQRLLGYKTLNLLNGHEDNSMMSTVLYSHVARTYIPAPKANFVKVVINGESWGVYSNVQQFNKEFTEENYKSTKGARWKVRGSPGGGGGLEYLGDDVESYKRRYEMKSGKDKNWKDFVNLCKVLNTTPPAQLEKALEPILDVESLLWFLALDVALINNDGYWVRASDYTIFEDEKGKFHIVPHDMNEAFHGAMGGPGGGGFFIMMPPPGDILPAPLQGMLRITEEQKKQVAELQKEVDAELAKILTPEQAKQLKEMRDRVPGGPGGFPGGPGGPPPGGGGPGGFPGGPPPGGGAPGGPPGGGGPRGGPGGGGVELDPLVALNDPSKPLRSKVLAVPSLKEKYLKNVRTIATDSLDWKKIGPVVAQYKALIEAEVAIDTRKLTSTEAFQRALSETPPDGPAGRGGMPVKSFVEQRQKYLLNYSPPKIVR